MSLSAPPPTNAAGRQLTDADSPLTEEDFYSCIDAQMAQVENFTLAKVTELRGTIGELEREVKGVSTSSTSRDDGDGGISVEGGGEEADEEKERIRGRADDAAKAFLTLEKYVNLNFMGE